MQSNTAKALFTTSSYLWV